MSLDHILLALLATPSSGYDLKKEFDEGARHYWAADLAQIYPTLKRLDEKGFVTVTDAPSRKGPPRRIYTRTRDGRAELLTWLQQGPVMGKQRLPYLAQLEHLYEVGDLDATHDFVSDLKTHFVALQRILTSAKVVDSDDVADAEFHELLTLRYGIAVCAARVAWCDESLDRIDRRRKKEAVP